MHPLDRPVWSALTTRQSHVAVGTGRALRFAPAYGPFAAAADTTEEGLAALAELVRAGPPLAVVEADEVPPPPPGTIILSRAACHQMIARHPVRVPDEPRIEDLADEDGPAMLALATLTRPGPFLARTHQLGRFVGIKQDSHLIAMAGERMQPTGFTEVSGVCTHPEQRGRGLAGLLIQKVAGRIAARGETPFLHSYADNARAIALYESLGFTFRRTVILTMLAPG